MIGVGLREGDYRGDYAAGAVFGEGAEPTHRYLLWRRWEHSARMVCFVGLNPSKATHDVDDHTVRRWRGFAKAWGFGGFFAVNLLALRETDSSQLELAAIHRGRHWVAHGRTGALNQRNDKWIWWAAERSELLVACWGAAPWGYVGERAAELVRLVQDGKPLHALKVTKDGHPGHPARLPNGLKPIPWLPPAGMGLGRGKARAVDGSAQPSPNDSARQANHRS